MISINGIWQITNKFYRLLCEISIQITNFNFVYFGFNKHQFSFINKRQKVFLIIDFINGILKKYNFFFNLYNSIILRR